MMVAGSSETLAHISQTTRRHIPLTEASTPYRTYYFSDVTAILSTAQPSRFCLHIPL
jgi:hypothetical protein